MHVCMCCVCVYAVCVRGACMHVCCVHVCVVLSVFGCVMCGVMCVVSCKLEWNIQDRFAEQVYKKWHSWGLATGMLLLSVNELYSKFGCS